MGRNNNDFQSGKSPDMEDIKTAYSEGKVTLEEAHDLNNTPADARKYKRIPGHGGSGGAGYERGENDFDDESYRMHAPGTPAGRSERSRKNARDTHKRAGLNVHPRKGY